jgi:uncharacterized protein (AIM24 family)
MQLKNETLYADQGLFCCCEDSVKVEAHKVESFSARAAGGEGRYQTKVSGTGIVVFRIPVPRREIMEIALENETLQVDGSFALLRTDNLHFTVEKASNSMLGAFTSGEGLLQTFREQDGYGLPRRNPCIRESLVCLIHPVTPQADSPPAPKIGDARE